MAVRREDFIQEILADPENDEIRLVCADWFEEQGDAARAELIRTQIARARLPEADPRQASLEARELRLLHAHGPRWCGSHKVFKKSRFRRGFIECVHIHLQHWLHHRRQMLALEPVREVRLTGFYRAPDDVISRVARTPEWQHIESLLLHHQGPHHAPRDNALLLLESPQLTRLKRLRMPGAAFSLTSRRRFEALPLLKRLEDLTLPYLDWAPNEPAEWLSDGPDAARGWANLKALRLPLWSRSPDLLLQLSRLPWWNQLTSLGISPNQNEPFRAALPRGLQTLRVEADDNRPMRGVEVDLLVEDAATLPLRHLEVSNVRFTAGDMERLFSGPRGSLEALSISRCDLGPGAAEVLADSPRLSSLSSLVLRQYDASGNRLIPRLFGGANFAALASLELAFGSTSSSRLDTLARRLQPGVLRELRLFHVEGSDGRFFSSPAARGLVWLRLTRDYHRDSREFLKLMNSVAALPSLCCLDGYPADARSLFPPQKVPWRAVCDEDLKTPRDDRKRLSPEQMPPVDRVVSGGYVWSPRQ